MRRGIYCGYMASLEPGGTRGGIKLFLGGVGLTVLSMWFFLDSVRVTAYGNGWISGGFGGFGGTGSMGILFVPLLIGIGGLSYNGRALWAWVVFGLGLALIIIEILSKLRFFYDLKLSHFLLMLGGFAAGIGLTLRSFRPDPPEVDGGSHLKDLEARNS